jgi:hypothetical protein
MAIDEHPNITTGRRRKKLVRIFGEDGTKAIRSGVMKTADTLKGVASRLDHWLESNRYGTEWR